MTGVFEHWWRDAGNIDRWAVFLETWRVRHDPARFRCCLPVSDLLRDVTMVCARADMRWIEQTCDLPPVRIRPDISSDFVDLVRLIRLHTAAVVLSYLGQYGPDARHHVHTVGVDLGDEASWRSLFEASGSLVSWHVGAGLPLIPAMPELLRGDTTQAGWFDMALSAARILRRVTADTIVCEAVSLLFEVLD